MPMFGEPFVNVAGDPLNDLRLLAAGILPKQWEQRSFLSVITFLPHKRYRWVGGGHPEKFSDIDP